MAFHKLFAAAALLPGGWAENVLFEVDGGGSFVAVTANATAEGAARAKGPVLPGLPTLPRHAFQRALAGLAAHAETGSGTEAPLRTRRPVLSRSDTLLKPEPWLALPAPTSLT